MYRTILVPLDGSPFGEAALPLALSLARRAGAVLHLVHVMPPIGTIYSEAPLYIDSSLERELFQHQRERNRVYLEGLAKKLGAMAPVVVQTTLLAGDIPTLLRNHASEVSADLVVMTTHARGPLGRFWLGSVADELVRKLPMPVLLVRPDEAVTSFEPEPAPTRILVPLDGQPLAEQVLDRAVELGTLLQARLTLFRIVKPVLPTPYPVEGASMAQIAQSLIEETTKIQGQLVQEAKDYLEKVAGGLRERGLQVTTLVEVEEKPALAILHHAAEIDLVAISTHGRPGLSRLFLGSVADKVIRGGHVPVLVYRPVEPKK